MFTCQNVSAAQAGTYHTRDDYYTQDINDQMPAQFAGTLAGALGLGRAFSKEKYLAALKGTFKGQAWKQAPSHKRAALDCTFSAPKSVSIAALVGGDTRVIAAHDLAVQEAMYFIEGLARTRVTVDGVTSQLPVTGIAYSSFRHETSREGDPNLHSHNVLFKAVQVAGSDELRSLDNSLILRAQHEADAIYKQVLAQKLRDVGYSLVTTKNGFEIDGFSQDVIDMFSTRRIKIDAHLEAQGKTRATSSALERQTAALSTRAAKVVYDRPKLAEYWREKAAYRDMQLPRKPTPQKGIHHAERQYRRARLDEQRTLADLGYQHLSQPDLASLTASRRKAIAARRADMLALSQRNVERDTASSDLLLLQDVPRGLDDNEEDADSNVRWRDEESGGLARHAITEAIAHFAERNSVIRSEHELVARAIQASEYRCDAIMMRAAIEDAVARGELIRGFNGRALVTRQALETEKSIDAAFRDGMGTMPAIADATLADQGIQQMQQRLAAVRIDARTSAGETLTNTDRAAILAGCQLTELQRAMVAGIVTTADQVAVVEGDAGTGKTTAMQAVQMVAEAQDVQVFGLAPSAQAVDSLKAAGIETITSQSALLNKRFWEKVRPGALIILDEAGLVDAAAMSKLLGLVKSAGARLVAVGDTKQYGSVQAGRALSQLRSKAEEAGKLLSLTDMRRGRTEEIKEIHFAARDLPAEALEKLAKAGHVTARQQEKHRLSALAKAYLDIPANERDSTLILAGTNADRVKLNSAIRERLGLPAGKPVGAFAAKDVTIAQAKLLAFYDVGDVVQFVTKSGEFEKGDTLEVLEKHPDRIVMRNSKGRLVEFAPAQHAGAATIGTRETIELSEGERIRFTAGDKEKGYLNGDKGKVVGFRPGFGPIHAKAIIQLDRTGEKITLDIEDGKPLPIRYGYAQTGHSAQGATAKHVLMYLLSDDPTIDAKRFYTDVTRAAETIKLFTDSTFAKSIAKLQRIVGIRRDEQLAHEALADVSLQERPAPPEPHLSPAVGADAWEKIFVPVKEYEGLGQGRDYGAALAAFAARFPGRNLYIGGSDYVQQKIVAAAVRDGLPIKFDAPALNKLYAQLAAEKLARDQERTRLAAERQAAWEARQTERKARQTKRAEQEARRVTPPPPSAQTTAQSAASREAAPTVLEIAQPAAAPATELPIDAPAPVDAALLFDGAQALRDQHPDAILAVAGQRYPGKVLAINETHLVQGGGQGVAVIHRLADLPQPPPAVDTLLDVRYPLDGGQAVYASRQLRNTNERD